MINTNYQPVNNETHKTTKIKKNMTFNHVEKNNTVELLMQEFIRASNEFPIIFIKHPELGIFQSVAVMGLERDENLFIKNNMWDGLYIPGSIGLYPFQFAKIQSKEENTDENKLGFFVDENCSRINEEEGEFLFDETGTESQTLASFRLSIMQYHRDKIATTEFIKYLVDNELLKEYSFNYDNNGTQAQITDLFMVDAEKLHKLPDSEYLKLRDNGYLSFIYAHLNSFHQLNLLTRRKILALNKG